MLEEKFTELELKDFAEKLENARGVMNTIIKDMDMSLFTGANMSKEKTNIDNVYYAGGTLCIDVSSLDIDNKPYKATVLMNISDETISWIHNGKQNQRMLMNIQTLWFAFYIYGNTKGFHRKYYRQCYLKSCIRHLYNFIMERRKVDEKGSLPDDAIISIYDMAEKATDFANEIFEKYGIETGKVYEKQS